MNFPTNFGQRTKWSFDHSSQSNFDFSSQKSTFWLFTILLDFPRFNFFLGFKVIPYLITFLISPLMLLFFLWLSCLNLKYNKLCMHETNSRSLTEYILYLSFSCSTFQAKVIQEAHQRGARWTRDRHMTTLLKTFPPIVLISCCFNVFLILSSFN